MILVYEHTTTFKASGSVRPSFTIKRLTDSKKAPRNTANNIRASLCIYIGKRKRESPSVHTIQSERRVDDVGGISRAGAGNIRFSHKPGSDPGRDCAEAGHGGNE
jgi:hypothetical protein